MKNAIRAQIALLVIAICFAMATPNVAFGQSGRIGWNGTWVGGWDQGTGVQVILAGDTLIGFYLRDDYKEIAASTNSSGGGKTFRWDKGEATLSRTPDGGGLLVVREVGKPQVSIPLRRE